MLHSTLQVSSPGHSPASIKSELTPHELAQKRTPELIPADGEGPLIADLVSRFFSFPVRGTLLFLR